MKKTILSFIVFTVLISLVLIGSSYSSAANKYPYGSPPWTIGMAQDTMDQPWRAFMVTSAAEEAKKFPKLIKGFIFTDGKGTNEKQIADVEDLIAHKVNLIMMSPREAQGLVPAVEAIKKAGIPLVVMDREIVGEDYTAFIGANNLPIGEKLGQYVVKKMGTNFKFLEIEGIPGATPTIQRHEGFFSVIEKYPDIKLLDHQPANYDLAPSIPIVEDWVTRFKGQFQAIYAHSDPMALGAVQVLKAHGYKPGEICVFSIDGQREAFEAIKEGWMTADCIYPTGGREGLDIALKILQGQPFPRRTILEAPLITPDNVNEYYNPKLQYVR